MARLLLLEDDPVLGQAVAEALEQHGFRVLWAKGEEEAWSLVLGEPLDAWSWT